MIFQGCRRTPSNLCYNASSPDEKALVEACQNYGVIFVGEEEVEANHGDDLDGEGSADAVMLRVLIRSKGQGDTIQVWKATTVQDTKAARDQKSKVF